VDNSVRILYIRSLSNAQAEKNVVVLNFEPKFFIFISAACEFGTGAEHPAPKARGDGISIRRLADIRKI
jgi:hypothetical protein